jgi:hypothetical protein
MTRFCELVEVAQVFVLEKVVFIFLEFLPQVDELFIVDPEDSRRSLRISFISDG